MSIIANFHVINNPYAGWWPDELFTELIERVTLDWVEHDLTPLIERGQKPHDSFGFVALDPTNRRVAAEGAVMVVISTGDKGEDYLTNGAAKVAELRDGIDPGERRYVLPHTLGSGMFNYGYASCVDGSEGGGSGANERQDRFLGNAWLNRFNLALADAQDAFQKSQEDDPEVDNPRWMALDNRPDPRYLHMVGRG